MNIKYIVFLSFVVCMIGCTALSHTPDPNESGGLNQARTHLAEGELFMARKITAGLLEENPKDAEAQKLMGKILEAEISRQKDLFEEKTLEEWTPDETKAEIRTWLERSQLLLTAKQYDQALYAAEKVFIYDPNNQKASELIDSIRQSAYKDGKKDMLVANEMMHDEVQERIERYRHEGHLAIQEKRWGTARLLVQKILLLSPEDPEGLAMQKQVQAQQPQK